MKRIILTLMTFGVFGCGPIQTKMPNYFDVTEGPIAEIKAHGVLKGWGLNKTHLEIFSGCFEGRDYSKENVLGKVYFPKDEFETKIISIPAGERLYFKYGTDHPSWVCHSQFSFVPQEGTRYLFDYDMVYAGCRINVTNITTNEPIDIVTYDKKRDESLLSGTALAWRQCKNLNAEVQTD